MKKSSFLKALFVAGLITLGTIAGTQESQDATEQSSPLGAVLVVGGMASLIAYGGARANRDGQEKEPD